MQNVVLRLCVLIKRYNTRSLRSRYRFSYRDIWQTRLITGRGGGGLDVRYPSVFSRAEQSSLTLRFQLRHSYHERSKLRREKWYYLPLSIHGAKSNEDTGSTSRLSPRANASIFLAFGFPIYYLTLIGITFNVNQCHLLWCRHNL